MARPTRTAFGADPAGGVQHGVVFTPWRHTRDTCDSLSDGPYQRPAGVLVERRQTSQALPLFLRCGDMLAGSARAVT